MFQLVFFLKIIAGTVMILIYTWFYIDRSTADIFKYFDDSKIMFDALRTSPVDFFKMLTGVDSKSPSLFKYYSKMIAWDDSDIMYNDNRIMIRFNCIMRFISFGNYYIHMVVMCFITLYGLTCLFRLFASEVKDKYFGIFCAVMLMPSVLFWGSGVLKDSVMLFATGMFLYNLNKVSTNSALLGNKILFVIGFLLMVFVKPYVLAVMMPCLFMIIFIKRKPQRNINRLSTWIVVYGIYVGLIYISKYFSQINVVELISLKQHQFMSLAIAVDSGSVVPIPELSTTMSLIAAVPNALFNIFFRPFIFESLSPVILLAASENILILITALICVLKMKLQNCYVTPWFFFSMLFVPVLYCLIGLIVPVAGALVRYKTIALPFLMTAFVILIDKSESNKILSRLGLKF